MLIKKEIAMQS